jgi:RNA polymerase sigma-70 factor, ECF subfamily
MINTITTEQPSPALPSTDAQPRFAPSASLSAAVSSGGHLMVRKLSGKILSTAGKPVASQEQAALATSEAALDKELVRRFLCGDEGAFTEIVVRYRHKILTLAGRFLSNHGDAEEITQDTFIRAHRGLVRFRGDSSLATWLRRIAVNLARNRYWFFFRRCRHLTQSLDAPVNAVTTGSFGDLVASSCADPARQAIVDEFEVVIADCMKKLDISHREILTRRNSLQHSYSDIASALGISEGTVKSRIARARGKLRGLVSAVCPEFAPEANIATWFEATEQRAMVA